MRDMGAILTEIRLNKAYVRHFSLNCSLFFAHKNLVLVNIICNIISKIR